MLLIILNARLVQLRMEIPIGGSDVIGKGLFHTHLVVRDIAKSVRFYSGLFGMEQVDFRDGTLVFLTTPGRNDLLALNPGGQWGYPGGCAKEQPREERLAGVQAGWRTSAICCRVSKNTSESSRP